MPNYRSTLIFILTFNIITLYSKRFYLNLHANLERTTPVMGRLYHSDGISHNTYFFLTLNSCQYPGLS